METEIEKQNMATVIGGWWERDPKEATLLLHGASVAVVGTSYEEYGDELDFLFEIVTTKREMTLEDN